ncbi:MAG TPA: ABC transporter ATP-binding protein [Micromonosporaceae bacterium]|nr:ABC transporter ATP-binding protein [Micromonosporaceae bacterium]
MAILLVAAVGSMATVTVVPFVIQRAVDGPIADGDPAGLALLGGVALLVGIAEAAFIFVRRWVQTGMALAIETDIRTDLYAHLQRLQVAFHDRWQSGQLLSRITGDLGVIRRFLSFGLVFGVVNVATYITVVILLVRLHWPLGLIVAAGALPVGLASRNFTHTYLATSRQMQEQQGDLATLVEESALGIRVIKAFGRRQHMSVRFAEQARGLRDTAVAKAGLLARMQSFLHLVPNVTLGVVLVWGVVAVAEEKLSPGTLLAFVSLQLMLVWPVDVLGWIIANGQEAMTAADRICEVLDTEPAIVDRPGAVAVVGGAGALRLERVKFSYPGGPPVLYEVDLDVRPGETLAVVGPTGCGKSTLLSLVPRLYDVTAGRITLDGRDIRDIQLSSLRRLVGTAFEEPLLFSMSVRENLTLGRPDASDAEIDEAIAVAQAHFVRDLPWGLETRIGEQGLSLSGGQRQRLSLARAVLCRPRVLILDDPLSALDVHTEARVEAGLTRALRGTTALLVTHRPSTVALADRVALLSGGRVAAVGTHSDLLATVPAYRALLIAESMSGHTNNHRIAAL